MHAKNQILKEKHLFKRKKSEPRVIRVFAFSTPAIIVKHHH